MYKFKFLLLVLVAIKFTLTADVNYDLYQAVRLINAPEYMKNVGLQFIQDYDDFGGFNSKLKDYFLHVVRQNYFGYEVNGDVQLTNGFIHHFHGVSYDNLNYKENINIINYSAELEKTMKFHNVSLFYDYFADLSKAKLKGTVILLIKEFDLVYGIQKFYVNNTITSSIEIKNVVGNTGPAYFNPSNPYTQIIHREMHFEFENLFSASNEYRKKLLDEIINKIPFPEIDFSK